MLRALPYLLLTLVTLGPIGAGLAAPTERAQPTPGLQYAEEAAGTSALWAQTGPQGWLTDHRPLAEFIPLSVTLGYSHQIGLGRLAWRASIAQTGGADATRFVSLDFIGAERVYSEGPVRPFLGFAFGMSLDLKAQRLSLGDDGYFNESNGATGGLGLAAISGADVRLGSRMFLRVEGRLRVYGGAGRTSVIWSAQSGLGFDL